VHAALPGIGPAHFARWLAVFRDTTLATCDAQAPHIFIRLAERIAQSLQTGIALHRAAAADNAN
jgi:hemoglobin